MRATRCAPARPLARRLYLFGLSGGALWVVYLFVGSLVLMDADGLVVQEREIITPPFDAQVLSFTARPGEKVAAGQTTRQRRFDADAGPDFQPRHAQGAARGAPDPDRRCGSPQSQTTLPAAENRSRTAKAAQAAIEKAFAGGFSTRVRQAETTRDAYDAARELESLRSERSALESESAAAKLNLSHLAEALERARATYRDGVVASPVEGTIGAQVAEPGAVLSHGEVMADVYHGAKYVLAYLPTNRMYGDRARPESDRDGWRQSRNRPGRTN